jgi:hypothetical protein
MQRANFQVKEQERLKEEDAREKNELNGYIVTSITAQFLDSLTTDVEIGVSNAPQINQNKLRLQKKEGAGSSSGIEELHFFS